MTQTRSRYRGFVGGILAGCLMSVVFGCGERQSASSAAPVPPPRVYEAESARAGAESGVPILASVMWPAEKEIDLRRGPEPIAGPLLRLDPAWGSYTGAGQSRINDGPWINHLDLEMRSRDDVDELVAFCARQGYRDAVIVVYADGDTRSGILEYDEVLRRVEAEP